MSFCENRQYADTILSDHQAGSAFAAGIQRLKLSLRQNRIWYDSLTEINKEVPSC